MKDNFSVQASFYRAFRPVYPPALYEFLLQHTSGRTLAWDCGTGNGQVAGALAAHFTRVLGTDISEAQLRHATPAENIVYALRPAEHSGLEDASADLITVGQALHWFPFDAFFAEVRRVLRPGGLFAAWGYQSLHTGIAEVDALFYEFYNEKMGPYWDAERQHVDEAYANISIPLQPVAAPEWFITQEWTVLHLQGYLQSWSATQHYIRQQGYDPVAPFIEKVAPLLPGAFPVTFPVFMRAGKL